jgi:hypothetical protein
MHKPPIKALRTAVTASVELPTIGIRILDHVTSYINPQAPDRKNINATSNLEGRAATADSASPSSSNL